MQEFKKRSAQQIIATLLDNRENPRCHSSPSRLQPPPTVHSDCHYRLWQRRYVPFNVFSPKEHMEKLDDMHNNPATAKLVSSPDQWPWSRFRFYYLNDSSVLGMDHLG
jgi:hypothetical protein